MAGPYPLPPDKDGNPRWRIYADAGPDAATGQRRRITKVVRGSKRDADLAHARLMVAVGDGRHGGSGDVTFGAALDAFVTHKSLSVEATTADTYRRQLAYIPDRYRAMAITKVSVEQLEALYAHLATKGHKRTGGPLSPASIHNVHAVVHGTFELARRRRWISVNPAADAEVPALRRHRPSPADPAKIAALFVEAEAAYPTVLPAYLRVSLAVGGRRSEIHGLRWSAVDWTRGVVVLRDTVVFASGRWQVKDHTKTGGERRVIIDPGTLAALQAVYDRAFSLALSCGIDLPPDAFIFTDAPDGSVPWIPNTTARRFSRCCAKVGLPPATRLHDLRHLMATHLIDQGVPIPVVSARLGHHQNSTTLDIYTGRVAASDQAAADTMGLFLDGPAP
jgi:integrase